MRQLAIGGVLGLGLLAGLGGSALAQGMPGIGGSGGFQPLVKPDNMGAKPAAPRGAALPGATPGRGAAPADKSTADLAPNAALFDAINRGDIAEARDAVNRGADIGAQNVLGMTPLELAVDLSRNDITFYLLSLRGASAGAISAKTVALAASRPVAAGTSKHPPRVVKVAARSPAPVAMRQYAAAPDPGRPDPAMGFLGFGASER